MSCWARTAAMRARWGGPGSPIILSGTASSWIYESRDEGATWRRLAKLDSADDLVVDNIVVDREIHRWCMRRHGNSITPTVGCG